MSDSATVTPPLPQADVRKPRRWSPSLIWLVPIVAALAGLILVVRALLSAGPTVTITFKSAEGLEPGKTVVKYKEVVVGKVRSISLSDDLQEVVARVDLSKDAAALAVDDSRFWVVRPRVDTGGVSGLGTLLSGAYIGVDVGKSSDKRRAFDGLEVPPPITNDQQGRRFVLKADDLGSLDIGSPVYFRRIPVGRIVGVDLNPGGDGVTLQAFVDAPYDHFVTAGTRFWNASGVDLSLTAGGLQVNTQSLASVLVGGVAFQDSAAALRDGSVAAVAAVADSEFQLYSDRAAALAPPDGAPMQIVMRFDESLRGLVSGAPVDFRGVELGAVESVRLEYDAERRRFSASVTAHIYPERLGGAYQTLRQGRDGEARTPVSVFASLVEGGLRAQLRTGNLITGQLYVALDFEPKAKRVSAPPQREPFEIPTARGSLSQLQTQIAEIASKFNEVPFGEIGRNARDALASADQLLKQLDQDLAPEARRALQEAQRTLDSATQALSPDTGLPQDLSRTLRELERAARSLRDLTGYLERQPQSLLRGKPELPEPTLSPIPQEPQP